jgi:hypothetical protein
LTARKKKEEKREANAEALRARRIAEPEGMGVAGVEAGCFTLLGRAFRGSGEEEVRAGRATTKTEE